MLGYRYQAAGWQVIRCREFRIPDALISKYLNNRLLFLFLFKHLEHAVGHNKSADNIKRTKYYCQKS